MDTDFLLVQENNEAKKHVSFAETINVYSNYISSLEIDDFDAFHPKSILLPSKFSMRTNIEGENNCSCLVIVLVLLLLSVFVILIIIVMQKLLFIEIESNINTNKGNI